MLKQSYMIHINCSTRITYFMLHSVSRTCEQHGDPQAKYTATYNFFLDRSGGFGPWRQAEISSVLLLSLLVESKISIFSSMHRLQRPDERLYVFDCVSTSSWMEKLWPLSLRSQMYLDNSVSLAYRMCLKDLVWLLKRVLKSRPTSYGVHSFMTEREDNFCYYLSGAPA